MKQGLKFLYHILPAYSLLLLAACQSGQKTETAEAEKNTASLVTTANDTLSCHSTIPSRFPVQQTTAQTGSVANDKAVPANGEDSPKGMVRIPAGTFQMGADSKDARKDEFPKHKVSVDGFWMDEHEVTNAQFAEFVKATGYQTTAERKPDWEELKKQLPPGTPKPSDDVLVASSLVFTAPSQPVALNNVAQWWNWVAGADWRHPEGPQSSIKGKEQHPVVHISWDDAVAYSKWAGKRLPTEAEWEWAVFI